MNKLSRILKEGGEAVETLSNDTVVPQSAQNINVDRSKAIKLDYSKLQSYHPTVLNAELAKLNREYQLELNKLSAAGKNNSNLLRSLKSKMTQINKIIASSSTPTQAQTRSTQPQTVVSPPSTTQEPKVSPTASVAGAVNSEKTAEGAAAVTQALKNWASKAASLLPSTQTATVETPATTASIQPTIEPKKVAENIKFKSLSKILKEGVFLDALKKLPHAEKMAETLKTHKAGQLPSLASQIKNFSLNNTQTTPKNFQDVDNEHRMKQYTKLLDYINKRRSLDPNYKPKSDPGIKSILNTNGQYFNWSGDIPISIKPLNSNPLVNAFQTALYKFKNF